MLRVSAAHHGLVAGSNPGRATNKKQALLESWAVFFSRNCSRFIRRRSFTSTSIDSASGRQRKERGESRMGTRAPRLPNRFSVLIVPPPPANFFHPREFSKRLFIGSPSSPRLTFFMRRSTITRKRRRPRIKSRKTTQRYEFISCNPYRPSGWREIFGAARFSTFSTVSTQSGRSYADRPFELVTGKE